ncbi:MAG: glycosyltransferase family 4 protein [Streptomyces sp.]|uniref:glycosyltransferase family 4 protein n=1 Tax=Streptomyces sp. TaxID=1931 RepID=UPI0025DFF15B|nr:glycosyltransferase family 1 protein [Streptomyces sp.]MBW8801196.1 glycosyltransferase family 4 protein [Streptomyces sp.]
MRLGVVLEQCLAPVPGGTGRYSLELALALHRTAPPGWELLGMTALHRRARLPALPFPVRQLPLPRRALVVAWERGHRPSARVDVLHALTPLHPQRSGTPLVVTVHDAVPWTHPETLTPRGAEWHRRMVGRAATTADLLVVPTQAVADELARHVALREVLVVGEGVSADLALPSDADRRAAALGLPERFLLTVSTLEPRKGLRRLVEALDALDEDLPLLCVGQAGWGDTGVAPDRVRLLGRVPDADLAVLLRRATALVVPSLDEGFGLPLLEGMSLGTPVLTSDAPALVEVAGGAALAVPLAELGEGLRRITSDESLRSRLREAGPRRAATYTWDGAAETLWRAYARLGEDGLRQA